MIWLSILLLAFSQLLLAYAISRLARIDRSSAGEDYPDAYEREIARLKKIKSKQSTLRVIPGGMK